MIEPQANLWSLVVSADIYAGLGPAAGVLIKISLSLISFTFETIETSGFLIASLMISNKCASNQNLHGESHLKRAFNLVW